MSLLDLPSKNTFQKKQNRPINLKRRLAEYLVQQLIFRRVLGKFPFHPITQAQIEFCGFAILSGIEAQGNPSWCTADITPATRT